MFNNTETARLIVSFRLCDSGQTTTIGVDIDDYNSLAAYEVVQIIARHVNEQYSSPVWHKVEVLNVVELQPRIVKPHSPLRMDTQCIACGNPFGHGGLPCPRMTIT